MKKHLALSVLVVGFLMAGNTYGDEDVYYCAEIDGNGFRYNKGSGKYERSGFFTDKFKMKLDKDSNRMELVFDGAPKESYECTTPTPQVQKLFSAQNIFTTSTLMLAMEGLFIPKVTDMLSEIVARLVFHTANATSFSP